jgi:hypothetical protein
LGTFNGTQICLPQESQASKDQRAKDIARQAASDAYQRAINNGFSPDVASKAAQSAGDAAARAIQNGSTPSQAQADAKAAGDAAASNASQSGSTPSSTMTAGSAAGAGQLAYDRSFAIAKAAGLSDTAAQAVANAAKSAATTAATNVLNNGGNTQQATNAADIAGKTSTASQLVGNSPTQAANDAAAAASGDNAARNAGPNGFNPNGPPSSATSGPTPATSNDPVGDFCKSNPQASMCKTTPDSSFAGACGTPPVCSGDAVMCAVAAATFATNCAMTQAPSSDSPEVALYKSESAKPQGDQTGSGATTVNIGPSQFDQTNLLGAAFGLSDLTVTVWHKTVTLPISQVNIWLQRLGYVLQAVTFLLCARVVIRG